jgi:hypothetical protein
MFQKFFKSANEQKSNNSLTRDKNHVDTSSEHARRIEWAPSWDQGAPLPQVFSNGHKTYLTYLINTPDPGWDGSYTTMTDNKSNDTFPLAIVNFIKPNSHRFGIVNDEAASGHALYNKGLQIYEAHIIENSGWIEELKTIHKVHACYSDKQWINNKHFLLFFHDEIFEIIAENYEIEIINSTFRDVAIDIAKRLNS